MTLSIAGDMGPCCSLLGRIYLSKNSFALPFPARKAKKSAS